MINQAISKYHDINLAESFMVGDSILDIELAVNMNWKNYNHNNIYQIKRISDLTQYI